MVNKFAISGVVIIIMTLFVLPAFSQEKPSLYVINMIVTRLVMQEASTISTREISDIKITKEFISPDKGHYCIDVSYNRISNKGEIFPEQGTFFIQKKGNVWIGGKDRRAP